MRDFSCTSGRMIFKSANMLSPPFLATQSWFVEGEVTALANAAATIFGSVNKEGRIGMRRNKNKSSFLHNEK